MKLAISSIAWRPEESDAVRELLVELAIRGVEVAPPQLFADPAHVDIGEVRMVRRTWNELGVEIIAQQALLFGHPELTLFGTAKRRQETADYLRAILCLGGELGAGPHIFGSPRNRARGDLSHAQAMAIAVPFFQELAVAANSFGTTLCIEPNAPDYGCDFITDTREALELVRQVDHPGFGFHLDAGVLTMNGESYEEALDLALPYLRHVHISEPFLAPIIGKQTDHNRLASALKTRGYNGWISIEMKRPESDTPLAILRECLEFAAEVYQP